MVPLPWRRACGGCGDKRAPRPLRPPVRLRAVVPASFRARSRLYFRTYPPPCWLLSGCTATKTPGCTAAQVGLQAWTARRRDVAQPLEPLEPPAGPGRMPSMRTNRSASASTSAPTKAPSHAWATSRTSRPEWIDTPGHHCGSRASSPSLRRQRGAWRSRGWRGRRRTTGGSGGGGAGGGPVRSVCLHGDPVGLVADHVRASSPTYRPRYSAPPTSHRRSRPALCSAVRLARSGFIASLSSLPSGLFGR